MRKYHSDNYRAVAICGSFNKHYKEIVEAADIFRKNGFVVLTPKIAGIKNNDNAFAILDGDESTNPLYLEDNHLSLSTQADFVYVCNVNGYIGKSVMLEIGYLMSMGQEIYFLENPIDEYLINETCKISKNVISPNHLCEKLQVNNNVFSWREWPDAFANETANFNFKKVK